MARGAPSQHTQPSRHNKKSWRKNINIDDVEDALENIRSEEIVTGSAFHKKPNEELFTVDLLGDESVRKTLPPAPVPKSTSTLTSLKILSQRSALPPIYSRPKTQIPKSEKHRLLRIAKKPIKGPFGVIIDTPPLPPDSLSTIDPTEFYDPWSQAPSETPNPDVEMNTNPNPSRLAPKKPPTTTSALPNSTTATTATTAASLPAVPKPHSGTSYNPLLSSHLSLLHTAAEQESEKGRDVKERILAALGGQRDDEEGVVMGMVVDPVARGAHAQAGVQAEGEGEEGEGEREGQEGAGEGVAKKPPQRKTRQQRLRASRLVKEKRVLAERAFKKRQLGYLAALPLRARARARAAQAQAKPPSGSTNTGGARFGLGIAGQRIGKHRVPEGLVDVQIGEELSESLRGLKPEGNLFKDRFVNLQQRALVEPRIRVLPKRRKNRVVEYEKHAWKRFDREQERMQM